MPTGPFEAGPKPARPPRKWAKAPSPRSLLGSWSPPIPAHQVAVYNIVPPQGSRPASASNSRATPVFLEGRRRLRRATTTRASRSTCRNCRSPDSDEGLILKNRLVFNGRAGDGTFITTPSTCFDWRSRPGHRTTSTRPTCSPARSPKRKNPATSSPPAPCRALESPLPPGTKPIDCDTHPLRPVDQRLDPNTAATDSPSGAITDSHACPHIDGGETRDSSNTKEAQVALPEGLGLNPSASQRVCSPAPTREFGKGSTAPVACPAASKVGTVEIETPPLPSSDGILKGNVFVGTQQSRDPASGDEYRIFVDAESARYGLSVRLVGRVSANPVTRAADDPLPGTAAGPVQLLRAEAGRRPAGGR